MLEWITKFGINPVLVDIGASYGVPQIWSSIAKESIYLGFDPDLRDIYEPEDGQFSRAVIINKAVVADDPGQVPFYLTKSPYCSSTLLQHKSNLENHIFAHLFEVDRTGCISIYWQDDCRPMFF